MIWRILEYIWNNPGVIVIKHPAVYLTLMHFTGIYPPWHKLLVYYGPCISLNAIKSLCCKKEQTGLLFPKKFDFILHFCIDLVSLTSCFRGIICWRLMLSSLNLWLTWQMGLARNIPAIDSSSGFFWLYAACWGMLSFTSAYCTATALHYQ